MNPTSSNVYHICVTRVSDSQILVCFALRQPFLSYIPFSKESAPNYHKMSLNHTRSNIPPYICYQYPRVPNFTLFHSTTTHFRDAGHFEKSALNATQMTLNLTRSNVPNSGKYTKFKKNKKN